MAVLHLLAIEPAANAERLGVGDLVGRHQPRPHGRKTIHAFGKGGLGRGDIKLELPRAQVVENGVAGHQRQRLVLWHVLAVTAHHDGQFGFKIKFGHAGRSGNGCAWGRHGGRHFENDARRLKWLDACFLGVVGIVAPHANDLARPRHRGKQMNRVQRREGDVGPGRLRVHMGRQPADGIGA